MTEPSFPSDDERASGDFEIVMACYFCGEEIAETDMDPCSMALEFRNGAYGEVSAHTDCLVRAQHSSGHFDPR